MLWHLLWSRESYNTSSPCYLGLGSLQALVCPFSTITKDRGSYYTAQLYVLNTTTAASRNNISSQARLFTVPCQPSFSANKWLSGPDFGSGFGLSTLISKPARSLFFFGRSFFSIKLLLFPISSTSPLLYLDPLPKVTQKSFSTANLTC